MGISFNPSIVRDGLVCYLDAANPASYTAGQNLLTYSEQFDNAAWSVYASTVSPDAAAGPFGGTSTADRLVENATNDNHFIYRLQTINNVTQTFSVFLKAQERTLVTLSFSNFVNFDTRANFNLAQGTLISVSANNTDYTNTSGRIDDVGNGWYRCSITTTKGTVNSSNHALILAFNGATTIFASNTSTGFLMWGAQLETNTSMGPYVQTVASAASSRSTTWVNLMGNAAYNGTLNGVIVHNSASSNTTLLSPASFLTAGSATSYIDIGNTDLRTVPHSIIAATRYRGQVANGRIISSPNNNYLLGTHNGRTDAFYAEGWVHLPVRAFDTNWHIYGSTGSSVVDIWTFWRDGVRLANNNDGSQGPNQIRIGANVWNEHADGHIGTILIYDRVLSDTEMAQTMAALRGRYNA